MIVSSILAATGAGMLSTFTPASGHAMWIGYQCLTGIGIGLGMQQVSFLPYFYYHQLVLINQ